MSLRIPSVSLMRFHESTFAEKLEEIMWWLELVTAGILVVLFSDGSLLSHTETRTWDSH